MTKMIPLNDPKEIPEGMSEAEAREFWQTHEITEAYLERAGAVSDDELPPVRPRASRHTSLRLEADLERRLKRLAGTRGMAYQTLLKQFVIERLYEEEKRAGL
ncbi:MAG: BrnA antitoxin family protein [Deinococcota bacterium]|jgi:predicted transcriptional regulator|nr:BrnA antitoxin family protein [Deinococcota bacterium]